MPVYIWLSLSISISSLCLSLTCLPPPSLSPSPSPSLHQSPSPSSSLLSSASILSFIIHLSTLSTGTKLFPCPSIQTPQDPIGWMVSVGQIQTLSSNSEYLRIWAERIVLTRSTGLVCYAVIYLFGSGRCAGLTENFNDLCGRYVWVMVPRPSLSAHQYEPHAS